MSSLVPWLVSGGFAAVLTILARVFLTLHRDVVEAERRRADDWRTAAQTQSATNEVHTANIAKLIGSVEQLAASQREVLALLQAQSAERRAA